MTGYTFKCTLSPKSKPASTIRCCCKKYKVESTATDIKASAFPRVDTLITIGLNNQIQTKVFVRLGSPDLYLVKPEGEINRLIM